MTDPDSVGEVDRPDVIERFAEAVAAGMGTVRFVIASTVLILVWLAVNIGGLVHFDRYPFILLNLMFSAQAFYTGALVIIATKAQRRRDLEFLRFIKAAVDRIELLSELAYEQQMRSEDS